jgi:subtilisin-like proprotein convertase family protein
MMKSTHRDRGRRASLVAACAALTLVLALGGVAEAKKAKTFSQQVTPNAGVPNGAPVGTPLTPLTSTITVPKKYKKKVVGDVNVTGFQTTGAGGAGAATDLDVYLTAPNGRTVLLIFAGPGQSVGPFTMDDDTTASTCFAAPCPNPFQSLNPPWAGTANLNNTFVGAFPTGPLSNFDGIKMKGAWTLKVYDIGANATTSVLNQWGLRIKPAKPVSE